MEHTRQRLTDPPTPPRGVVGDMQRLKQNGAASAAELREFLSRMQGKSPQEALGVMAESSLVKSILISTLGFAVVLAVFTLVPYALSGDGEPAAQPQAKSDVNSPAAEPQAEPASKPETQTTEAPLVEAAPATSTAPNLDKAARVLGIDETKGTDPTDVPDLDSILDKSLE